MNLVMLPKVLYTFYKAGRVPFLVGEKGIGKSRVVKDAAKYIGDQIGDPNFGFIDLRLGTQEVGDLVGIPRERDGRTIWACPDWWPAEGTNGILFLDEFNRAGTHDVIQAMFQLVLGDKEFEYDAKGNVIGWHIQRRMHTHLLPKGWGIIAAGNPDNSEYVVQSIDTAMLDRFCQIRIEVDKEESMNWFRDNLKEQELWKFVGVEGEPFGKPEIFDLVIKPSRRSYEMIDDMLQHMEENDFGAFGQEVLAGFIGDSLGTRLYKHLKANLLRPIPASEILNCKDWDKFKEERLSSYITLDQKHLELLDVTLKDINATIKKRKPTKNQAENIFTFCQLVPPDLALKFYEDSIIEENFVPVILAHLPNTSNEFTRKLIETLGISSGEIDEILEKMAECVEEYKKSQAEAKK